MDERLVLEAVTGREKPIVGSGCSWSDRVFIRQELSQEPGVNTITPHGQPVRDITLFLDQPFRFKHESITDGWQGRDLSYVTGCH